MLNVGLIGLGPEWEQRYKPALANLRRRLRVTCVHTAVAAHAEQVATELQCDVAPGLVSLIEREDVRALLVLDTAWYPGAPARFACEAAKPAFLAGRLANLLSSTDLLAQRAAESGVTLMPDFAHRYTPSTSRLRELIATRLGRPLSLSVDVASLVEHSAEGTAPCAARDLLAATIDWCTNVVGATPTTVHAATGIPTEEDSPADSGDQRLELRVEFRRPAAGGEVPRACIRLSRNTGESTANLRAQSASLRLEAKVQCARGTVWIENADQLKWESAGEQKQESLTADRPDVEVMLDHFARRVMGGLLPVPSLEDLCRACNLVQAALSTSPG